ncbi:sugar kinase [Leptobacterium flavescens]|uniref:Sugar kinase n=1 Tax=Leptobacterium flavescens TaxID=472055 RepID=A0A6P0UK26_9FLAO|nr:sugar kinase [Leptobacterium flavescens]NER13721.1 sugar kinase [Leptobacterium flavescens]
MKSFVTFGEIMLRLTPQEALQPLVDASALKMGFAGAESNVAVSLAIQGNRVSYITALPDSPLGQAAINSLRKWGVLTHSILRQGERIGTYFIEQGASLIPYKVHYDRKYSAIQMIDKNTFNWPELLKGQDYLFLSGITPSLSTNCAHEVMQATRSARQAGTKVCFDLNFRRTLWKDMKQAKAVYREIIKNTDIVIGNEGAVDDIFDFSSAKKSQQARAEELMLRLNGEFGTKTIAFTLRDASSNSRQKLSGILFKDHNFYPTRTYDIEIMERIGGGDAFAAALLHTLANKWEPEKAIEYASAAFALKHSIPGDLNLSTTEEILEVIENKSFGFVKR